jgi:Lon protease-like protein
LRFFYPLLSFVWLACPLTSGALVLCFSRAGRVTAAAAVPAAFGTLAHISDFDRDEDGLLGIVAEGGARFRVTRTRIRADGLLRGDTRLWPGELEVEVPVEFALLQSILERLIETMAPHLRHVPRGNYEDASWLGFRLAELLPLDAGEQQRMLELTDPLQRLAELRDIVPRFQKP